MIVGVFLLLEELRAKDTYWNRVIKDAPFLSSCWRELGDRKVANNVRNGVLSSANGDTTLCGDADCVLPVLPKPPHRHLRDSTGKLVRFISE